MSNPQGENNPMAAAVSAAPPPPVPVAQPMVAYAVDPTAPYGRDPVTGTPYSDKSKIVAGLLQLFLGSFGVGRFYMGSTGIGAAQLVLFVVGLVLTVVLIGLFLLAGLWLWTFIDGIVLLAGNPKDAQGRLLRG